MSNRKASMAQGRVVLEIFEDLPAERLQGIGLGLLHLVREYLSGEPPKDISLGVVRQVLGLPSLLVNVWAKVFWSETQPEVRSGQAVIRKPAKERFAALVRLRPTDVGLLNDALPNDVIDLALAWGYKPVPRAALDELFRLPNFRGGTSGTAMVPLVDAAYAYVRIDDFGCVRETDCINPTYPDYRTTWSVIVACLES